MYNKFSIILKWLINGWFYVITFNLKSTLGTWLFHLLWCLVFKTKALIASHLEHKIKKDFLLKPKSRICITSLSKSCHQEPRRSKRKSPLLLQNRRPHPEFIHATNANGFMMIRDEAHLLPRGAENAV